MSILIDYRQGIRKDGSNNHLDLIPYIQKLNVKVEKADLKWGDAAFEGNGPDGTIAIGVERKRLHDMLSCIEDSHYSASQMIGMRQMYAVSILMVEGHWKPHTGNGMLMEGFTGGINFGYCAPRGRKMMYAKIRRYLFSVALSGVIVCYTRDPEHTAYDIVELFHYFQKKWKDHTALLNPQKMNIPQLMGHPSLTLKWAHTLNGIGAKHGQDAERLFKKPINLATADESDWLRIPGLGVKTAQSIVKEIMGVSRW